MSPTSPPDPSGTARPRRIGVYGGTFDPPHIGHLIIASEIRAALGLDGVLFVPASIPPHKDPARVTPARHRLAMLQLAVKDETWFSVDTLELERDGPSFTAETLRAIHVREPDAALWFIMGGDSLADLHTWRMPDRILGVARLAVAVRPGWEIDLATVTCRVPESAGRVDVVPTPLVDVSSRDIRDRVRAEQTVRYLVPEAVRFYIQQHHLYRVDPRID